MITAALLLVFLSVVLPPVECNGISRRSFVYAIPATMVNDFGDNPSAQKSYQAFGIITEATASSSSASPKRAKTVKRMCEGVLLSPLVVLTAAECQSSNTATMKFEFLGDSIRIIDGVKAGRCLLYKLRRKPKKEPTAYPFLSWYTGSESDDDRYGIREDSANVEREIYLSSLFAHKSAGYSTEMTSINTALQNCDFTKRVRLIALKCMRQDVCEGETVLSGSAFFTFTQTARKKIVSIAGLVSLRSSGSFCKGTPRDGVSTEETPKTPQCNDPYVCGTRFTDRDVKAILLGARQLDDQLKNHTNIIPSGTKST